ncbi:T9SS type A sorting domain-containing protein [Olleya sp. R77988]|uniref:T9SS type A sorting domain-containing protein n=1 Tax=Olleya sp. R77988 TaxID=3093875 RepID=UPI0037C72D8F
MKKFIPLLFFLFSILFFNYSSAQVTIAQQNFDGGTPTMTYTGGTLTSANGPFPNTPNYVSANNGLQVNNTSQDIEFSTVNTSAYSNVSFSLRLASFAGTSGNGADTTDDVTISISTDGGASYSEELRVRGIGNAKWGFSGTNAGTGNASAIYDGDNSLTIFQPVSGGYRTTDGYSYLSITDLPNSTLLRVKVEITNNNANEIWVIDDALIEGVSSSPCITPTAQPTTLNFSNITNTSFDGNFSASIPAADEYLIIYSTSATLGANPVDTTTYTNGDTIGSGTVLQSNSSNSFSLAGLNPSTTYYLFVYSYNVSCSGGPLYFTTSPLNNNETTLSEPCLEESFTSTTFAPTNWISSGASRSTTAADYNTAPAGVSFNSNNGYLTTDVISNPSSLDFYLGRTGNTTTKTLNVNVSTTSQTGPFTTVAVFDHSNVPSSTYNQYTVDLSTYNTEANVWIQFEKVSTTTSPWRFDDVSVTCSSACTPTQTITSFAPSSGPELSEITITGTGFTVGSTVDFNGTAATIVSQTATQIIAEVPIGASTGVITITEAGCPLDSLTDFTLLSGSCSGGSGGIPAGFTDLMFSGIYDDQTDSCHYFELLNPTTSPIDLSDYTIGLDNNFTLGSTVPTTGFSGGTLTLSGTLAAETTIMIRLSSAGACTSCPSVTPDLSFINGGINNNDRLVLVKDYGTGSATAQDVWQNNTTPGAGFDVGYVFTRDNSATAPSSTFSLTDWVYDGDEDCFGFAITITPSPTIDVQPIDINDCDAADVNISVTAGGGGSLSYQWKYNNGGSGWSDVTSAAFSPGIVSGETSTDLSISGLNLDTYQFYCEVTESGVCSVATDAIQITMSNTIWNGSAWSNGLPDLTKMAVIDGSYDTSANGSFQACSLVINTSGTSPEYRLTVSNSTFVEVENTVTVDGELYVETQGAFVQNNNNSSFILSANGESLVNKMTTPLNSVYEYTYWSSPVENTTIGQGLAFANTNRRYWFNAANYLDVLTEINNTDTFTAGPDGIDDDGNDWTYISSGSTVMTPGVGYISMHTPVGFTVGSQYTYTFNGAFNTGIITSSILFNGANGDEDWNLIGNPYPSAIDANAFLTANSSVIQEVAYLWSHNTPANGNASGNQGANFSNNDYAIITTGSGNTAGGDMIIPNGYIPSGQSFFVQGIANGNVTFDNDYRMADTSSNDQFFRTNTTNNTNRIWVNLTSDNGIFNQILIAYVNGATDGKDSMSFDAKRTIYNETAAEIYTSIPNETDRFAIQGKSTGSLTIDEVIPVGFNTQISDPTIYTFSIAQLEGQFFDTNTVYLIDYLNNSIHDLSASDYSFTSNVGEFDSRFEIVFNPNSLSTSDYTTNNVDLSIIELSDNQVQFSITNSLTIKSIKIFDLLGKEIYNFKCNNATEIINLDNLSQSLYFAKVKLSNGQEITKKAIKK